MRRRLLVVLLALGTVGGYASGFASLARHRHHLRHHCHHGAWERGWSPNSPHGRWEPSSQREVGPPLTTTRVSVHTASP
ncbi:hypothetical protein [Corallococcus macrosporus]|uniref:Uncharacterized protein n=1 Tax=Myxococcus fulvus (strain ATCC BAA-855 / HW-1) TaxID=483219 RepID=F8CHS7_MYXFH|nr:hypothetical protein [Corallococcus macrosporus]AEI68760.1 hypothetical protein LILAB_34395 [Corallococcus macrosporus]